MPAIGKGLGVMTKLSKVKEVALVCRWYKAVEVDGDM